MRKNKESKTETKLRTQFEDKMFEKEITQKDLERIIVDYYKKHSKDTFEYPKSRYDKLSSGDPEQQYTMEDIVVLTLLNSDLKGRVKLVN